jgi:hypothetical protein
MVMLKGGTQVEKGLYLSPLDGRHVTMQAAGILPGEQSAGFVKLSPSVLLFVAPLFGMMFVLFLPLFGMGVFLAAWLVPVIGTLSAIAITGIRINSGIGSRSAFNWNPSRSYFSGSRKKEKPGRRNMVRNSSNKKGGN